MSVPQETLKTDKPKEYTSCFKLQAPVYDILPPTAAIADYAIGLEKLLANG